MDEVIKRIFRRISREMFFNQRLRFLFIRRYVNQQRSDQLLAVTHDPLLNLFGVLFRIFDIFIGRNIKNKTDNQFVFLRVELEGFEFRLFIVFFKEHEDALAVRRFLIVVLLGGGVNQPEMNIIAAGDEGIVPEVLRRFDIILILIGPVEFDFLAFIWNGVDALLVSPLGNEVPFFIITVEEAVEIGINIRLQPGEVDTERELFFQLGITLRLFTLHDLNAELFALFLDAGDLFLDLSGISGKRGQRFLNLPWQPFRQKPFNLRLADIHNPIDSKIQIGFVKLENPLQEIDETLQLFSHFVSSKSVVHSNRVRYLALWGRLYNLPKLFFALRKTISYPAPARCRSGPNVGLGNWAKRLGRSERSEIPDTAPSWGAEVHFFQSMVS